MYLKRIKIIYFFIRPKFLLSLLFVQITTYLFILSNHGLIAYYELKQNTKSLQNEIYELDKEINRQQNKTQKDSKEITNDFIRDFLLYQEKVHILKFIHPSPQRLLVPKEKLSLLPSLQNYYIISNFFLLIPLVSLFFYISVIRKKN